MVSVIGSQNPPRGLGPMIWVARASTGAAAGAGCARDVKVITG